MAGKCTNYFLGGNTSQGFFSHFNYIISQKDASRIITLKGGPGTGKSSLMKKIGRYYLDLGYDVEFHHCSSDDNSLDGILIKEKRVALLDGTAPHMIDPVNPGAVDELINMALCLNDEKIRPFKNEILSINKKISSAFSRGYSYFKAARALYDDWSILNSQAADSFEINKVKNRLQQELLPSCISTPGSKRHLFATGFTPNGIVTYITNIIESFDKIYVLKGAPGTGKSDILRHISDEAVQCGFDVVELHTPLIPENIEHLIIPAANAAILTCNEITHVNFEGTIIDLNQLLNQNVISDNSDKIEESSELFYDLLEKGLTSIKDAKELHDKLESYYIPNMDFNVADNIYNELILKINRL